MGIALPGNSAEVLQYDNRLHYTLSGYLVLHNPQEYLCLQIFSTQYVSLDRSLDGISSGTFYTLWNSLFLVIKIQLSDILKPCAYHPVCQFPYYSGYG